MAETVIMPKLGFDMAEGTLVRWVKKPGEAVTKGEVLAEIETDKATVEVESPFEGVIARQLVEQGAVVPVGDPIAIVSAPGEEIKEVQSAGGEPGKPEQKPPEPVDQKPEPTAQAAEQPAAPPTASTSEKVETPAAPKAAAPSEKTETQKPPQPFEETETQKPPQPSEETGRGTTFASPLARKVALERGIDLQNIQGSGPGGRIVRRDLEKAVPKAERPPIPEGKIPPDGEKPGTRTPTLILSSRDAHAQEDKRVPLTRLRQAIGRRMAQSTQQIPSFFVTRDYGVEQLANLRQQVNEVLPEDEKLSYNDFVVKAAALTLRQFPNLNASLDGDNMIQHGHIHIGVAVAVEGGLLTVVCRDADLKPLRVISAELNGMIERVTAGKVRQEDIEGSTFSTSNLGMFGVEDFVAIINPPEAAILAIGAVRSVPVVVNGEIKSGVRMKATISADHRLTDGAEAARFMQALATYLENPTLLLL